MKKRKFDFSWKISLLFYGKRDVIDAIIDYCRHVLKFKGDC